MYNAYTPCTVNIVYEVYNVHVVYTWCKMCTLSIYCMIVYNQCTMWHHVHLVYNVQCTLHCITHCMYNEVYIECTVSTQLVYIVYTTLYTRYAVYTYTTYCVQYIAECTHSTPSVHCVYLLFTTDNMMTTSRSVHYTYITRKRKQEM